MDAFAAHAARRPDDVALVWRDERIGYGELHRGACRARARLDALGLPPRAPVGVVAVKSPDTIALVLACLGARHPVLLPPVDLTDSALAAVFTRAGCATVLSTEASPFADHIIDPRSGPEASAVASGPVDPDAVAFLLTTSGSTGAPKVVPLTTGAVGAFTAWAGERFGIGPRDAVLNYAPLNFDLCLFDLWTTLSVGGRVVLVEPKHATRGTHLRELITLHGVTVVQAVPMVWQLLAESSGTDDPPLDRVEHVISTGDALTRRGLDSLAALFPRARAYNLYGCTETNDSFLHEFDPATTTVPVPLGRPIEGVSALVVDGGTVLSGPGTGELHVHTPFQTPGYLDPTLDAGRFGPHPTGGGPRYFRSGDLVRRDRDGTLTLLGRDDFHVKVRGVRVDTDQVEQVLLGHDDVVEAVVFGRPDPVAGTSLHAVIRPSAASGLTSLAVRVHCARHLARAAIPATIVLVGAALPRTSTGKPDRARIKRAHLQEN